MTQSPGPGEGRYEEPGVSGGPYTTPPADPARDAYTSAPAGTEGTPTGPTSAGAFATGATQAEAAEIDRRGDAERAVRARTDDDGVYGAGGGGVTGSDGPGGAGYAGSGARAATYSPAAGSGASAFSREGDPRSIGEIASDLLKDASTLIRQEVELAKAEVRESATKAGKGVGMLVGAGIAAFFLLLFLSLALWWALAIAIGSYDAPALGWSGLIVAVLYAIVAGVLVAVGRGELKKVRGVPKTAETVSKIPNAVTGNEEKNR